MAEDDSSTKAVSMTPRETEILVAALRNVKTGDLQVGATLSIHQMSPSRPYIPVTNTFFQIEFDNLAEELGLKDGNSARTQWSKVKSKLFGKKLATTAATNADGESTAAKPKPARRTTTPKSGKKTPKSEVAVKDEEDDADGSSSATAVENGDADGEVGGPQGKIDCRISCTYSSPQLDSTSFDSMITDSHVLNRCCLYSKDRRHTSVSRVHWQEAGSQNQSREGS